jgi:hypothetical protein
VSLQRTDEADVAFGLEVEIEIEEEFDVLAGAIAEACKLIVERLLDADRRVELGSAGRATEAGHVEFRTPTVEQKDVGLERREAALAHVLAELADVVERADRREAHFLGVVQAVGAAVRPVQAEPIADGPAEHFAYGHAEGFCLHVNERILDGRDRLLDKAAWRLTRARIEVRGDELDRARVLAKSISRQAS